MNGNQPFNLKTKELELRNLKQTISKTLLSIGNANPLVELIVQFWWPDLCSKYVHVDLSSILTDNCKNLEDVENISTALNLLTKYASNLLSPLKLRPNGWNIIDFLNPIFHEKVYPIKGTHIILSKLGYTEYRDEAMAFPPSAEPNREHVAEIAVELMAEKMELSYYLNSCHPYPFLIEKYLPFISRCRAVTSASKPHLGLNTNLPLAGSKFEETELKQVNLKEVEQKKILPNNIPVMVLDQVVSIAPGDETAVTEFLAMDKCDICGEAFAQWTCHLCDNKNLCTKCDELWHLHPKRRTHNRKQFGSEELNTTENEKNRRGRENEIHLLKQNVGSTHSAVSSSTYVPKLANSNSITTSRVLIPGVSPSWNTLAEVNQTYDPLNDDDDIQKILSQARHPPAFYVPPTSSGLKQHNGDIGIGINIVPPNTSMFLSPFDSKKQLQATWLSELNSAVPSGDPLTFAGNENQKRSDYSAIPNIAVIKKERNYDRSASASGILFNCSKERNGTLLEAEEELYWDCEHCTFRNSYSASSKNKICSMCNKTSDNLHIHSVKKTDNTSKVAATSPTHLVRASSASEPCSDRDNIDYFGRKKEQLRSKFVEFQDEIFREKKIAWEKFQNKESYEDKQELPVLLTSSTTLKEQHNLNSQLPKPASAGNIVSEAAGEVAPKPDSQNSVEFRRHADLNAEPTQHSPPGNSYSIDRQHYRSKFVDSADEIYVEKKAAQERYRKMENSINKYFEGSETGDQMEFKLEHFIGFRDPKFAGNPVRHIGAAVQLSEKQQLPSILRPGVEKQDADKKISGSSNRLSKIEQLEQQKKAQDMYNHGMTTVRLIKVVESNGCLEAELNSVLSLCGNDDPYSYYTEQWSLLVDGVFKKLQEKISISRKSNPVELIRTALCGSLGNVDTAVDIFMQRFEAVLKDCAMENSPDNRRRLLRSLDSSGGDVETAKCILIREKFFKHIWNEEENMVADTVNVVDDDIYQRATKHLDKELSKILLDKREARERRIRVILAETNLPGWQRAENVLTILEDPSLISPESTLVDIVDAVKNRGTVDESRQFLQQQCEICYDVFPSRLIKSMGCCQCKICRDCTKNYFEVVIRERFVRNLVCPVCGLPEIDTVTEQTETHFQFLLLLLRSLVSNEVYELFQMKLRDWNLMMDSSFRWCASNDCKSGFLIDPDQHQNKIACPNCHCYMCQQCKKPWEDQHEGLTCEEFQSWKETNDPEVQALGLARHLEENGIECPWCKCRYSLAKGGCMHFTCIQCRHEFCSGCLQPFRRGQNCSLLRSCAKAGLHCHHPRDCLFYLRDRDTAQLQKLLLDNNVQYDTEPSQTRLLAGLDGQRCSVMEQKQTQSGFKDEPCGKEVPQNFAGLCEIHYKEYLVGLINKNNIDPAKIMKQEELIILLKRVEKHVPKKKKNDNDKQYEESLLKLVQKQLPLPPRQMSRSAQPTNSAADHADAAVFECSVTDGCLRHGIGSYKNAQVATKGLRLHEVKLSGRGVQNFTEHNCALLTHVKKDSGYSSLVLLQNSDS